MPSTRSIHLDDANADVTLVLEYGDILAIEQAGNATIKIDEETGKRKLDGSFIVARKQALLSIAREIKYQGQSAVPITMDIIRKLSVKDGKKLEGSIADLYNEANAVNDEADPKGSTSKKP